MHLFVNWISNPKLLTYRCSIGLFFFLLPNIMNGVATNTESEKVNKWQIYWIIRNKNDEKNNPFILKHLQRRTIYLSKLM